MTMEWISPPAGASAPLDAITAYRVRTAMAQPTHSARQPWWLVLIELSETSLTKFQNLVKKHGLGKDLIVPACYAHDMEHSAESWLVAIFARVSLINKLNMHGNRFGVVNLRDGLIVDQDLIDTLSRAPEISPLPPVPQGTVVMGIIDDGIALGHTLFRRSPKRTRIDYALIMGARPDAAYPSQCSLGRCFSAKDIDKLLDAHIREGDLDERSFYETTGQIDFFDGQFSPVSLRRSHGTHVAALAAGFRMGTCKKQRPILCVSLPSAVTEDVTGQTMLPAVALALQCIATQARRYVLKGKKGQTAPLVLNFSFGNYAGPHDGTGMFARLFEQYLDKGDGSTHHATVLPAGNGNLARVHSEILLESTAKGRYAIRTLHLVIPPDDRTASHVQFWLPLPDVKPLGFAKLRVKTPCGVSSRWLVLEPGKRPMILRDQEGHALAELSFVIERYPTERGVATLSINPTASLDTSIALGPAGRWTVDFAPTASNVPADPPYLTAQAIQVWIRRDETLPGFRPGGRQAVFDDPNYDWFDAYGAPRAVDPEHPKALVRRKGTLSGFATGVSTFVVGAAVGKTYKISGYSATGSVTQNPNVTLPAGTPPRIGPDAMARGDDSPIQRGVYSAGSRSGSFVRLSGTSVAAPRFARWLADKMSIDPSLDRARLSNLISMLPEIPLDGPAERGGGRPMLELALPLQNVPIDLLQSGIVPIRNGGEV